MENIYFDETPLHKKDYILKCKNKTLVLSMQF